MKIMESSRSVSYNTCIHYVLCAAFMLTSFAASFCTAEERVSENIEATARNTTWINPFGECWRGYWIPGVAADDCSSNFIETSDHVRSTEEYSPEEYSSLATQKNANEKLLLRRINFSSDALFVSHRAVLKSTGKSMLDGLVRELKDTNYEVITVVGHTDRSGGAAYNQKLSLRRASAVKTYLESRVAPSTRIIDDGKGESQPITKRGDCEGLKGKKLFTCSRPDRRVDIEVTGTKKLSTSFILSSGVPQAI
jgi:OOP family OmpA-OmpF porin